MSTNTQSYDKSAKKGVQNKILIKNDLISADLIMAAKSDIFSCLIHPMEYTSLVSVTFTYLPIITEESHGTISIVSEDNRYEGGKKKHTFHFPTNKPIKIAAVGFGQSRTEDGCPIKITISKAILGLTLDTVVGELGIIPQFRCSEKIPGEISPYLYCLKTRKKLSPINGSSLLGHVGAIALLEEKVK
jgi:hypothetical protein